MDDELTFDAVIQRWWTTGKVEEVMEILSLSNHRGWTVAHELVSNGKIFLDEVVLGLKDDQGWTVAHEQARHGFIFHNHHILNLKDIHNSTVREVGLVEKLTEQARTGRDGTRYSLQIEDSRALIRELNRL